MKRRTIWNLALVTVAVAAGLALSAKPWEAYFKQRESTDRQVTEMRRAEASRAELSRRKAQVESPVGRERLAREQGYRKPGEQPADGS